MFDVQTGIWNYVATKIKFVLNEECKWMWFKTVEKMLKIMDMAICCLTKNIKIFSLFNSKTYKGEQKAINCLK